jgi:NTE family protein
MNKIQVFVVLLLIFILYLNVSSQTDSLKKCPKVGIVLSGGAARGFAQIGVLKVLEEAGMPIDYIGGTSIGAIIGGLYAIGYSADSLHKMVVSQNWSELFTDRIPRKFLSFEEKENDGKYFIPYPVSSEKFQLPSGLIAGQNLEFLLYKLTWNTSEIDDFSQFPIPFLCVAADIEKGDAVVLQNGSLPEAMRASMAIPTVFTPVQIDGKLLVDGGLIDNFPVDEVKKMGADIIIGVDVGFEPYNGKNLNSMIHLIEQSFFIHTIDDNKKRQNQCNILIKPDLQNYSLSNFDLADTLIYVGEQAARKQFKKLKALADSIRNLGSTNPPVVLPEKKYITVKEIKIEGNKRTPKQFILSKLKIKTPGNICDKELEEGLRRIYGSLLYQKVSYKFFKTEGGNILTIEVAERPQSFFSLGINYNSDLKASIIFNTSFYNLIFPGSKFSIDALLGQNPRLDVTYFKFSGWNPTEKRPYPFTGLRWDYGINLYTNNYELFNYENDKKISSYGYTDIALSAFTQTVLFNSYALGIGVQNEYTYMQYDLNPLNISNSSNRFFNFYAYLKFDTYNTSYFPESGMQLNADARYLTKIYDKDIRPGTVINCNYSIALPIAKKFTAIASAFSGLSLTDTIPFSYQYRVGGIGAMYVKNAFPFIGHRFLEFRTQNCLIARCDFQYQFVKKHYLIISANAGKLASLPGKLITNGTNITGYGITYGYNSIIGPIELTIMDSPDNDLLYYLNIGFWF